MGVAFAIFLAAAILIGTSIYLRQRRKKLEAELGIQIPTRRSNRNLPPPVATTELNVDRPRPDVAEFHVDGTHAIVRFDVPLGDDETDEILSDLLVREAIEVVREKRHSLPLSHITEVVAMAGRGDVRRVGSAKLDQPGTLPPRAEGVDILNLSALGDDPLLASFREKSESSILPGVEAHERSDDLAPLSNEIRLPKAVATGLRAQGIDPGNLSPGDLVTGLLTLFGYQVNPAGLTAWMASKAGETTYLVEERHEPGEHPELEESAIRKFLIEFGSSGANRGMLVTDKYGPFEIYELERR
ncbi:MAG TPA: hypothetical protein VHL55_03580, partial [Acidimicrobiia bacterium]|nr:hypothetical protein [Acidimicrobiia bacterium]